MFMNVCGSVRVKVFLRILGKETITFDNLASALRDFALSLKTESPSIILSHKDELLSFVPYLRPSEVCLVAHGYQHVGLKSMDWWNKFSLEAVNTMFDMDGKEMAGLLYSLSKLDNNISLIKKLPITPLIVDQINPWINILEPTDLALTIRALSLLQIQNPEAYQRALDISDSFSLLDILFFIHSNSQGRILNMDFYQKMCHNSIKFIGEMDLRHIKSIATTLSVGGIKSHQYFNLLSKQLERISKSHQINSHDLISLLMSFTRQCFPLDTIMPIDYQLYISTLKHLGESEETISSIDKNKNESVLYPLPSAKGVFEDLIAKFIPSFNDNDMSIVTRGISMLHLNLKPLALDDLFDSLIKQLKSGVFIGDKLANLTLSTATIKGSKNSYWQELDNCIRNQPDVTPEICARILTAISNSNNFSYYKSRITSHCKKTVLSNLDQLSTRAISALCKSFEKTYDTQSASNSKLADEIIKRSGELIFWDLSPILSMYVTLGLCPKNVFNTLKDRFNNIKHTMDIKSKSTIERLIGKITYM